MNKYIYKLLLAGSGVLSLFCLGIIAFCIIILSNKTITINDYNEHISKLVSWYIDKEIYFEQIEIKNNSMQDKYEVRVNNLILKDEKNYKNLTIKNIKLDFKLVNLINKSSKFTSIDIKDLYVDYISNNEQPSNLKLNFLDDFLRVSDVLNIYDSSIKIKLSDRLYYISNINLKKIGINNIDINGSIKYRDNYFQKIDKLLVFSSTKLNNSNTINIKFKDVIIDEFIVNKYLQNNNLAINGYISGELSIYFINSLLSNIDFNLYSKKLFPKLKSSFKYKKIVIDKFPEIEKLEIKGSYNYRKKYLSIQELSLNFINGGDKNGKLYLISQYNFSDKINDINISFENVDFTKFMSIENFGLYSNIFSNISGKTNILIDKNDVNYINLNIDDIQNKDVTIRNIIYNFNEGLGLNNLSFSLSTSYKIVDDVVNHYNTFNNEEIIKFNPEDKINLDAILYLENSLSASINGNIIFHENNKLLSDKVLLKSAKYTINYNNQYTDIFAVLNTNIADMKVSFKKEYLKPTIINFIAPIVQKEIAKIRYIYDFKGDAFLNCTLTYSDLKSYNCNLDLTNSSFLIPIFKYKKDVKEDAKFSISGQLNDASRFNKINFIYSNMDNFISGNIRFLDTYNDYVIKFNKFILYKNNLNLSAYYNNKKLSLDIYSGALNLNTFIDGSSDYKNFIDISINGKLDELFIKNFTINDATLTFESNNKQKSLYIEGNYYSNESIIYNHKNTDNFNVLSYNLQVSNAGKFFDLLDYKSEIKDGILTSQGFIGELDDDNSIMGTISIDKFKVMKAPLFAELLLAASFTGLFELLDNEGIGFEQFDAQFTGKENIYNITKSRAYGFSLGITGSGKIDYLNKNMDLSGSIIPAYKINSLLNNVPLLGQLLTAQEDEGIFAINYDADGLWEKPKIVVNPFSLLTPGIIRNIFN